jgi:hypothetical protein
MFAHFSERKINHWLTQRGAAPDFYTEFYPEASEVSDEMVTNAVLDGTQYRSAKIALLYGSEAVRRAPDMLFASRFVATAGVARDFCLDQRFTVAQAGQYLSAAFEFTQTVFDLGFVSEDKLLAPSLKKFGGNLVAINGAEEPEQVAAEWEAYVDQAVQGTYLLGENGDVLEDTTMGLIGWVNRSLISRIENDRFPTLEVNPHEEEDNPGGDFASYGSDAAFFEAIRNKRQEAKQ